MGETWNVEVWSVDIKAWGHWVVLLVLYLPVLWGERGNGRTPRAGLSRPAYRPNPRPPAPAPWLVVLTWCR